MKLVFVSLVMGGGRACALLSAFAYPGSAMVLTSRMTADAVAYDTMLLFWRIVTNLFFREIRPRGAYNIPRQGPVIFVAGPHHNQASCFAFYDDKSSMFA
jgi:1-acyl-sn-glycerol-3-phosphate acyltransferase